VISNVQDGPFGCRQARRRGHGGREDQRVATHVAFNQCCDDGGGVEFPDDSCSMPTSSRQLTSCPSWQARSSRETPNLIPLAMARRFPFIATLMTASPAKLHDSATSVFSASAA